MSGQACWECKEKPRRKRGLFPDQFCEECGSRHDSLTPEQRRENLKAIFDRNITAIGASVTGPELRGMISQVANSELKKLRGLDGSVSRP